MSIEVQLRRGTASQNSGFTGVEGELIYVTDTKELVVHDGSTVGGTNVAASVADGSVTIAKLEDIAANTILGNNTGSSSAILELTPAQVRTLLNFDTEVANNTAVAANTAKVTNATHTGEVTGSAALTITNNAVTTAKINNNAVTSDKLSTTLDFGSIV
jgi:hypothetical protein